jgi:Domain of unknown function (DUF4112)
MRARSKAEVERIRATVDQWRRLSDRLFEIGPLKIGLDGILTWIPGVGGVYGLGAGGFLLLQAHRARASRSTMTKMALLLGADALVGEVPVLGDVFDFLFRAHARSARILLSDMERTHYADDSAAAGREALHRAEMKATGRKRRLVYLHE